MSSIEVVEPTINPKVPLIQILYEMVPKNPIAAMAEGNMLQIIVLDVYKRQRWTFAYFSRGWVGKN